MRASELIGCRVYDAAGHDVGAVHDLHFRMQQRPDGSRACQLDALECGGIGFGHRLGYGEHAMRGPWPFPQLFRYLARRSLVVPWTEITAIDGIFAGLLTILAWLLLRPEQDPLQDLSRPGSDDQDPAGTKSVPASQEDRCQGSHGGIRGRPPTPFGR